MRGRPLNICFWMAIVNVHFVQLGNAEDYNVAGTKSASQTSTKAPFVQHPLAGLLVLGRFDEFKTHLEEALEAFLATGQDPSSKLHYEVFVFSSFYPISKIYKCIPIQGKDHGRVCQHVLLPNPDKGADSAFVIKYVLAPSKDQVQSSADKGLKQMLANRIDGILLKNNQHIKYVFSICLAFHKASVGLAFTREASDGVAFE